MDIEDGDHVHAWKMDAMLAQVGNVMASGKCHGRYTPRDVLRCATHFCRRRHGLRAHAEGWACGVGCWPQAWVEDVITRRVAKHVVKWLNVDGSWMEGCLSFHLSGRVRPGLAPGRMRLGAARCSDCHKSGAGWWPTARAGDGEWPAEVPKRPQRRPAL